MTFEKTLRVELIKAYVSEYGREAWDRKTEAEKSETLHSLLVSFLGATRKHSK